MDGAIKNAHFFFTSDLNVDLSFGHVLYRHTRYTRRYSVYPENAYTVVYPTERNDNLPTRESHRKNICKRQT